MKIKAQKADITTSSANIVTLNVGGEYNVAKFKDRASKLSSMGRI